MLTISQAARGLAKRVAWEVSTSIAILFAVLAIVFLAWNTYFRVEAGVRAIAPQIENFLNIGDTFQLKVQLLSLLSGGTVDHFALKMPDGKVLAGDLNPNSALFLRWIEGSVHLVRTFDITFPPGQTASLTVAKKVHLELFLIVLLLYLAVFFLVRHFMYERLVLSFANDLTNPIAKLASSISSFKGYDDLISSTALRESLRYKELNEMLDSFLKLLSRLQMEESLRLGAEREAMLSEVARQVAHDIRSPLSALNVLIKHSTEVPEDDRRIFQQATRRINDIANSLLSKCKGDVIGGSGYVKMGTIPIYLSTLVDSVVSEKCVQYRNLPNLMITAEVNSAYGCFAEVNPTDLARVISNLVNNSVEAIGGQRGTVTVLLLDEGRQVRLSIQDSGCGISQEVVGLLGKERVTFGKSGLESGLGLGLLHARKTIESFGGQLEIKTDHKPGARVDLVLPKGVPPGWFAERIRIPPNCTVLTVDDDQSIHYVWQRRFGEDGFAKAISHVSQTSLEQLESWVQKFRAEDVFCLIDYEFVSSQRNGLDAIELLGLADKSILVTSRFEDESVQSRVANLGMKMLPKNQVGTVPICVSHLDT